MRSSLLSTVEIIFAIAMGVVGVIGLRQSFLLRNLPMQAEGDVRTPQEVAQTLFNDRVKHEVDPLRKPTAFLFLNRILAGQEWIHTAQNSPEPVQVEPGSNLYWCCRVSAKSMEPDDPAHPSKDNMRKIAVMVYRDYKPGSDQEPAAKFNATVIPETAKWDQKDEKKDAKAGGAAAP